MKYDIHFRNGGKITVELNRSMDEFADFLNEPQQRCWGVLAGSDGPSALVNVIDIIAVVPHQEPARGAAALAVIIDRDDDRWVEILPGRWGLIDSSSHRSLESIQEEFGPLRS